MYSTHYTTSHDGVDQFLEEQLRQAGAGGIREFINLIESHDDRAEEMFAVIARKFVREGDRTGLRCFVRSFFPRISQESQIELVLFFCQAQSN